MPESLQILETIIGLHQLNEYIVSDTFLDSFYTAGA